jgi:hypothetical protein
MPVTAKWPSKIAQHTELSARSSNLSERRPTQDAYERAVAFVQARRLVRPGQKLLVATGGGPRSLGLLGFLLKARDAFGIEHLAVASIEWTLDEEADAAEAVADVGRLVRAHALDFHAVRPSGVGAGGRPVDLHTELSALAREGGFDRVALGHTRDDDAARVLLELCRGGIDTIRGLAPRVRGGLIRPFLALSDGEAMAFAPPWPPGSATNFAPRASEEESMRREVLPRLEVLRPETTWRLQELGRRCRERRSRALRGSVPSRGRGG